MNLSKWSRQSSETHRLHKRACVAHRADALLRTLLVSGWAQGLRIKPFLPTWTPQTPSLPWPAQRRDMRQPSRHENCLRGDRAAQAHRHIPALPTPASQNDTYELPHCHYGSPNWATSTSAILPASCRMTTNREGRHTHPVCHARPTWATSISTGIVREARLVALQHRLIDDLRASCETGNSGCQLRSRNDSCERHYLRLHVVDRPVDI